MSRTAGRIIGVDEAGYGPNLGPLVISATRWELPASPESAELGALLAEVVSPLPTTDGRLQIADSKCVHQPSRGLAPLELPVLALLAVAGCRPASWRGLRAALHGEAASGADDFAAPWYAECDVPLPVACRPDDVRQAAERLSAGLAAAGVALSAIHSDIVTERRFNRLTVSSGSKGATLTELSLALVGTLWRPDDSTPTCVIGDKHGGRNRYGGALCELAGGQLPATREESRNCSTYQLGAAEFRFEARGERHLPVASASMVSKYVREVAMLAFNAFWQRLLPGLQATKGYPQDAVRFRREIAGSCDRLGFPEEIYWRNR